MKTQEITQELVERPLHRLVSLRRVLKIVKEVYDKTLWKPLSILLIDSTNATRRLKQT